jgi:plastocyanin
MNRLRFLPALLAGLALVLAACTGTTTEPTTEPTDSPSAAASVAASESAEESEAAGGGETVDLTGFAFDPTELTIAAGTEVTFVNADSAAHTVTEGTNGSAADDPIIDEEVAGGAETSFTFDEPGTYDITCLFHPDMNMTITVE